MTLFSIISLFILTVIITVVIELGFDGDHEVLIFGVLLIILFFWFLFYAIVTENKINMIHSKTTEYSEYIEIDSFHDSTCVIYNGAKEFYHQRNEQIKTVDDSISPYCELRHTITEYEYKHLPILYRQNSIDHEIDTIFYLQNLF